MFPLHSFDNGLCLDDRLGVELLEISHSVRFKYKTFRFQNLKTINQRSRITWFLRRVDFWQNRGGPSGGVPAFRSVDPWSEDRMFYSSIFGILGNVRAIERDWEAWIDIHGWDLFVRVFKIFGVYWMKLKKYFSF